MNLPPPESSSSSSSSNSSDEVEVGPHGALFMVMGYLQLPELLSFQRVCKSFVSPISGDPLLWRRIAVRPPLSARLTDDVLLRMASRAEGKMTSLSLFECPRITDNALLRVVRANPGIKQLHVPGCTHVTGEGVVRVAWWLAGHNGGLERLHLYGIRNIRWEHFFVLNSLLRNGNEHKVPQQLFYGNACTLSGNGEDNRPIDVDICPKCWCISPVYDCTRDGCRLELFWLLILPEKQRRQARSQSRCSFQDAGCQRRCHHQSSPETEGGGTCKRHSDAKVRKGTIRG